MNNAVDAVGTYQQEEKTGDREMKSSKAENGQPVLEEQETDSNIFGGNATDSAGRKETSSEEAVIYSADKGHDDGWSFMGLAEQAKRNQSDMVALLKGRISITEIVV